MKKLSRNTFRFIIPILSVLFISMATNPVQASTFTFNFSNIANGGGTVAGVVILNNTDTAATSVTVTFNMAGFGIGEYVGAPSFNTFTVVSGQITSALFLDFGAANTAPVVTCCSLRLSAGSSNLTGLANNPVDLAESGNTGLTFTPVSAVPLPAALPLFVTGLGVLGLLGWRRKRKAV